MSNSRYLSTHPCIPLYTQKRDGEGEGNVHVHIQSGARDPKETKNNKNKLNVHGVSICAANYASFQRRASFQTNAIANK